MGASRNACWGVPPGDVNGLHRRSDESGSSFNTVTGSRGWTTGKMVVRFQAVALISSFYIALRSAVISTLFLSSGHRAGKAAGA